MTNEESVHRGRLLYVAEFLTTFHKFFSKDDVERKGPVSVDDIGQAIRYRQRLHQHYDLENELFMLRKDGILTEDQLKEWQAAVEVSQASIMSSSLSDKALHELLRRFEVWSTQALANVALTYCLPRSASSASHDDKSPELVCCSTLMSFPGAAHFLKIMPEVQEVSAHTGESDSNDHDHVCGLGSPPNAWTWQQYVRICNMVSLLRDPVDASRSPLTAASPSLIGQRREDLKMSDSSRLTPADLVALWTRAQRNTSALLHLLHLFEISEASDDPKELTELYSIRGDSGHRGKVLVHKDTDKEESQSEVKPRYVAKFVGNHKKTRKFVLSISHLLDKLVEWAVTNQTLYTYRYIREGILQGKLARKRQCLDDANEGIGAKRSKIMSQCPDGTNEGVGAKRRKIISNGNEKELLHACQCYVLRWFARRNRKVASIIFTSKLDHVSLFPYEDLVQKLVEHNVPDKVKQRLLVRESNDRTLARIDRRIRIGKFDGEVEQNFQAVVVSLLQALASVTPADVLTVSDVREACDDYKLLYETFLAGRDAAEAAELLLDTDLDTDENPIDLLLSFTAPWNGNCSACDRGLGSDKVIHCTSCDGVFHGKCADVCDRRSLIDLVQSYDPLAQMFFVRVPSGLTSPDFSSALHPQLRWTQLPIHIQKKVGPDGKQQTIGVEIRQTEECEMALDKLLGQCPVSELGTREMIASFPLKVDHKGVLMTEVFDGENYAGNAAGLKPGDIITEVTIPEVDTNSSQKYVLDKLTRVERLALLKDASELLVTVQRPSKSLLTSSRQWLGRVQETNAVYKDVLRLEPGEVWFCSDCQVMTELQGSKNRIFAEARWCKSLIRRLGMESYSLPFHDELHSVQRGIPMYASLRRLDAMMEFISLKHDESLTEQNRSERLNSVGNPFMLPPSIVSSLADGANDGRTTPSRRVSWAPEDMEQKPMELLCKGMDMMLCRYDPDQEHWNDERTALLRRFLMLFSVRLLCTSKASSTIRSSGHLSHAFIARPPWIQDSCIVCRSRPKRTTASEIHVCDSKDCQQPFPLRKERQGESENGDEASLSPENRRKKPAVAVLAATHSRTTSFMRPDTGSVARVNEYDERSSLVGTPLLVLPGDPVLQLVSRKLNQSIDHMDRPMVFIVASYLPYPYGQSEAVSSDQSGDGEGMFHILPVFTADQLKFLLGECTMRRPVDAYATSDSWTELKALRLKGVIRMSAAELMMKLKETSAIREAIDAAVGAIASFSIVADPSLDCHTKDFVAGASTETVSSIVSEAFCGKAPDLVDEYSTLIDGLMRCHSPFVRHMIDVLFPNDLNEADAIDLCSVVSEDDTDDVYDTFGDGQTDIGRGSSAAQNTNVVKGSLLSSREGQHDTDDVDDIFGNGRTDIERGSSAAQNTDVVNGSLLSSREGQHEEFGVPAMDMLSEIEAAFEVPAPSFANQNVETRPLCQPRFPLSPTWPIPPQRPIVPSPSHHQMSSPVRYRQYQRATGVPGSYLSQSDLYHPGLPGTILTRVETAFLVEAHARSLPLLGRRLLCPRYSLDVAAYQQKLVFRGDCSTIPRVRRGLWNYIVQADYRRNLQETGDVIFREGTYVYRMPVSVLPLDRLTESFLAQYLANNRRSSPVDRIRGGGPSVEDSEDIENEATSQATILANIPEEEWQNTLVHGKCKTTKQGCDVGEATIIGVVQRLVVTERPSEEEEGNEVPVAVFYLSNMGYIDGTLTLLFAPDQLHIVQVGSDEARIADQCELLPKLMALHSRTESDDRMDMIPQGAEASDKIVFDQRCATTEDAPATEQTNQYSQEVSSMLDDALQLAKRLCDRREGPTPIGELPDGRTVLWMHSDPRALYLRMPTNDEFAIASCRVLQSLPPNRAPLDEGIATGSNGRDCERYSCPWGCNGTAPAALAVVRQESEALYFTLPSQLRDHLRASHDFGLQADLVEIEGGGYMYRIAEGDMILTLSAQLKTTIRSRCLSLAKGLGMTSLGTIFIEDRPALNLEAMALISKGRKGAKLRHLLSLWSRIARLFAVESTGLFRLESGEWAAKRTVGSPERPTRLTDITSQPAANGCLIDVLNVRSSGESDSFHCELCRLRSDSSTEANIENTSVDSTTLSTCGGASCDLLSQLFGPEHIPGSVSAQQGCGRAGVARVLLIRIASNIPTSLRQVDASGGHAWSVPGGYVWEEGNYQNWRYLVERGRDANTFLQAFVVLVRSVNTAKLPRWWKGAREGWSSSLVTMVLSSFSGLFLRLYAFDAAIFEFLASTGTVAIQGEGSIPEELKGLTTKEIMAKVQMWATELGCERFDGDNAEECLLCGDGGDLICCEFCSNVQHAACCQPPIEDVSTLDVWACLPCINDFAAAVKEVF